MNPAVRYGSVVIQGRPPSWRSAIELGLAPTSHGSYGLYRALYLLAAQMQSSEVPQPDRAQQETLARFFGEVPDIAANDGIVPTLSQIHGELVHLAWADHLDVVGHFGDARTNPPHVEWVTSRSNFELEDFRTLWQRAAGFLLESGQGNDAQ